MPFNLSPSRGFDTSARARFTNKACRINISISHARVAVRLALAFGVVCLVMSLSAAVGIWRLAGLQDIADDLGGASSERALLAR